MRSRWKLKMTSSRQRKHRRRLPQCLAYRKAIDISVEVERANICASLSERSKAFPWSLSLCLSEIKISAIPSLWTWLPPTSNSLENLESVQGQTFFYIETFLEFKLMWCFQTAGLVIEIRTPVTSTINQTTADQIANIELELMVATVQYCHPLSVYNMHCTQSIPSQ